MTSNFIEGIYDQEPLLDFFILESPGNKNFS